MPSLPIRMPQLGESAAEATVREWLVAIGDEVRVDQDLIEVETEKSILTVTAPATGILTSQDVAADDRCAVGNVLGQLEVSKEQAGDLNTPTAPEVEDPPPLAERERIEAPVSVDGELVVPARTAGMGYYSPRVRARMSEYGLRSDDITAIRGSGRAGRVSVKDLEKFLSEIDERQVSPASPMRVAVADSMRRSWNRPLATVAMEVHLDPLMAHRRTVEGRPSATVYAVAALGRALAKDDAAVCRLIGNRLIHPESIDIAVAIEVEDGVLNPVLRQADGTDLAGLTKGYQEAFEEAKERRVSPEHSGHSVATVSNYGTFGITWATPVPLPDQTLILGVGAVRNVPDWNPKTKSWDRIRAAEVTLTFDHRVCDGGHAGRLLKQIVDLLEHPEKL